MSRLLYNFGIQAYYLGIRVAALFNSKAKLWVQGRKHWLASLQEAKAELGDSIFWIHCASLGEFEQGRPVIEAIKKKMPNVSIVLSFFSPSGYEIRKNYALADYVCYLPLDTRKNAQQFIQTLQPEVAIFVKYEFWYHFLTQLQQAKVTTLLVSAIFRPDQAFFKKRGGFFRKMLHTFDHLFVQNEVSKDLLDGIGIKNVMVGGDTRIDRVLAIAREGKVLPKIKAFCGSSPILIAGSTWPADEQFLLPFFNTLEGDWKLIIAPHEIHEEHIVQIEKQLKKPFIRYTQSEGALLEEQQVMIINNIGLLSAIYKYGTIAYIGGGFGKGIHNILEPGAFGLPIIFGPKYQKFEEARSMVKMEAAFSIRDETDLAKIFEQIYSEDRYEVISQNVHHYISQNQGATEQVMAYLETVVSS